MGRSGQLGQVVKTRVVFSRGSEKDPDGNTIMAQNIRNREGFEGEAGASSFDPGEKTSG